MERLDKKEMQSDKLMHLGEIFQIFRTFVDNLNIVHWLFLFKQLPVLWLGTLILNINRSILCRFSCLTLSDLQVFFFLHGTLFFNARRKIFSPSWSDVKTRLFLSMCHSRYKVWKKKNIWGKEKCYLLVAQTQF